MTSNEQNLQALFWVEEYNTIIHQKKISKDECGKKVATHIHSSLFVFILGRDSVYAVSPKTIVSSFVDLMKLGCEVLIHHAVNIDVKYYFNQLKDFAFT